MPLPLGHAFAGITVAVASSNKINFKKNWKFFFFCIFLSILPDFDFGFVSIFGWDRNIFHRTFSHSILFIVLVALVLVYSGIFKNIFNRKKLFIVYSSILFSHLILDYLAFDTYPPSKGIMLFFPFSIDYFASPISIFPSVDASREGMHLALSILREAGIELLLLGGLSLGVLKLKSNGKLKNNMAGSL